MNKTLDLATFVLLIAGGVNWLLVGLFGFDLVAAIGGTEFGLRNWFNAAVYILVGLSAIYQAAIYRRVRQTVVTGGTVEPMERPQRPPTRLSPR